MIHPPVTQIRNFTRATIGELSTYQDLDAPEEHHEPLVAWARIDVAKGPPMARLPLTRFQCALRDVPREARHPP